MTHLRMLEPGQGLRYKLSRVAAHASRQYHHYRTAWRVGKCGSRSCIFRPSALVGAAYVSLGEDVAIFRNARIEVFRPTSGRFALEIGSQTTVHQDVHFGAAESLRIGRGVLMAAGCYLTDHDHYWGDPCHPVVFNNTIDIAPTSIGDYCWLGERVVVLKGVSVGERSIIGAGSVVTRSIPPFSVAVGVPARVIRRWDPASHAWVKAEETVA